ncbi:MAG: polyprenol monophosphomannose synthase [Ktedonobacterales bacterium]|nr:polyprenol monophosphomannose synthase [Ktedonobacterales bacterium]
MRSIIIMPTYNERDNLPEIARAIFAAAPWVNILVVDDNSPDGTGKIADQLAAEDGRLRVLHRTGKQGLGTAYIAGFKLAIEHNFDRIFEMDADFSHDPSYLPAFLRASENAELVIGSRYIPGGSTPNWSWLRRFISGGGNTFARSLLRMPVHDCTSGFRCYHRSALEAINLDSIRAQGYAFQVELVYRVLRARLRVTEIPITFVDRRVGQSKMSRRIFVEGFQYVMQTRREQGLLPRPVPGQVTVAPPETMPATVSAGQR